MRQLATIQRIEKIEPIENYDRVEYATVLGWHVIVAKGEFSPGDLCVYVEVDSVLPEWPEFEFLRKRNFRIRTIKMCGVISQGICFKLDILPMKENLAAREGRLGVGADVTDVLKIVKHDTQIDEETKEAANNAKDSWIVRKLKRFKIFRRMFAKKSGNFPDFIPKTDEERIQNLPFIIKETAETSIQGKAYSATIKLDGQSATYFLYREGFFRRTKLGVCSRNFWLRSRSANNYWFIADKYELLDKLKKIEQDLWMNIAIQGEIAGPGIQKNRLKLASKRFFVHNIYDIDKKQYITNDGMSKICSVYGLEMVPWVDNTKYGGTNIKLINGSSEVMEISPETTVDEIVEFSKGTVTIDGETTTREGVVIRPVYKIFHKRVGRVSFKAINPDYLIEHGE